MINVYHKGDEFMAAHHQDEPMMKVVFFIAGIFLIYKLLVPLFSYSGSSSSGSTDRNSFYSNIMCKSTGSLSYFSPTKPKTSQSMLSLMLSLFYSNFTKMNAGNPLSYITYSVPTLNAVDPSSEIARINGQLPDNSAIDDENNNETPASKTQSKERTAANKNATTKSAISSSTEEDQNKIVKPLVIPIHKRKLIPEQPEVLVLHSHTTESYNPKHKENNNFTTDLENSIVRVGDSLVADLTDLYGISVIHDISIHDLPTRIGAYGRARPTIISLLHKYPSIKLIIDLHRDGNVPKARETAIISGEDYARVMFVAGTKFKTHKNYNKASVKFDQLFDYLYPGFSRGIDYKNNVYNQDLLPNMLLIEVGSNSNTLEEAVRTSSLIARVVDAYLK